MSENRYPPGYVPLTIHQLNGSADAGMGKPRKSNGPRSGGQGRNDRSNDRRGDRNDRNDRGDRNNNRSGRGGERRDGRNSSRGPSSRPSSQSEDFGNRDSRPRDSKLSFGSDNGNQSGGDDQD